MTCLADWPNQFLQFILNIQFEFSSVVNIAILSILNKNKSEKPLKISIKKWPS